MSPLRISCHTARDKTSWISFLKWQVYSLVRTEDTVFLTNRLDFSVCVFVPCVSGWGWGWGVYSVFMGHESGLKMTEPWASLVAQWLRVCLLMQGTRVRALVWEDPTCQGAAGPVSHNYWACASGACAPQQERPRWWEARAPRWRVAPACRNWRKPLHRNEDPTQPKINK